jgi:hypothetical protein
MTGAFFVLGLYVVAVVVLCAFALGAAEDDE